MFRGCNSTAKDAKELNKGLKFKVLVSKFNRKGCKRIDLRFEV